MMRRSSYQSMLAMLAVGAFVLVGCTQKATIQTEFVEGVVTLDGQPVAGATVTFVPVSEGQGMSATGMTDDQGKYKLSAVGGSGGAAAAAGGGTLEGEYYVGVIKNVVPASSEEEEEGQQSPSAGPPQEAPIQYMVPQKYNNPRESGLKVTVKKGKNNIPIELTSR